MYTIDQVFEILSAYKITTHKETVRSWVRKGVIQAEPIESRKKGYRVSEKALRTFISSRMPEGWEFFGPLAEHPEQTFEKEEENVPRYTELDVKAIKEQVREEMWFELMSKFIFEGYFVLKKADIKAAIQHRRHSKEFGDFVWERCLQHKMGYATPRVPYLLKYFKFEGERIPFDRTASEQDDQIIYALIESIRLKRVNGKYKS